MTRGPALDRLAPGAALQVRWFEGLRVAERGPREPHRHDYHELIWVAAGRGEHRIDGEPLPVVPGTVTVIGRGQVHVFERGEGLHGAILRFGDEAVAGGDERVVAGFLLAGAGGRTIPVPPGAVAALEALLRALADEAGRPADGASAAVQRHLLAAVLLWLERWYEAGRTERRAADDADVQLHRRFLARLEADFARHHDAQHYADALAVPAPALAKALAARTGRTTKELVTDRVMLEAVRLLRFTDLTVQEVAHATGFADPLYFSRAFKRHTGASPQAYRAAVR